MARVALLIAAVVTLLMGCLFTYIGWNSRRQAQRIASMPRWSAADALQADSGREGLLEGRIGPAVAEATPGFAFFFRSRLTGFRKDEDGSRRPTWRGTEQRLPPLVIQSGGSEIRTTGDYAVTFRGSDPSHLTTETLEVGVTEKLEGLTPGALVTLMGRRDLDAKGQTIFVAEQLASGTAGEFLAGERGSARFGWIAGGALLLVALILGVIAISLP